MQADLNHGLKQLNLFGFEPLVQIQGPNAVDTWDDMDMYLTVRKSLSELGTMEDIILHGTAQAFGAEVALLMSETSDIWADYANPTELIGRTGTAGTAQRALYIALRHLQQPVDVIIEEDCEDPSVLANYSSVFISDPNLKESAARGLGSWVEGSPKRTVWASAGGMLDELNATNAAMLELFGLASYSLKNHTNMVQFVKQDLAFTPVLDQVTLASGTADPTFGVYGTRASLALNASAGGSSKVLATFSDSSPAVIEREVGQGRAILCAFHPSLSYFHPATPPLPTARGATDESFNHMCPRDFDSAAKKVVAMGLSPLLDPPPTLASAPGHHEKMGGLIETGVVTAPGKGTVIPIVDWSGEKMTRDLKVKLTRPIAFATAELASGGAVQVAADKQSFAVPELRVADAIILR